MEVYTVMEKVKRKSMHQNVYEIVQKRLEFIFCEFDNVYVSFSGGKDSGVLLNLCIDYIRQNHLPRKLGVLHLDYEAQYQFTTNYVDETLSSNQDILEVYRCCVPFKGATCTSMHETYWRPWEESKRDIWVREMPIADVYKKEDFDFFDDTLWDYDFQDLFGEWLHKRKNAKKTICLVGIRTQESLNRWRAIYSDKMPNKYKKKMWTKKMYDNVYNGYPIFDWLSTDIWTANAKFGWTYNKLYDVYYMAGLNIDQMRVASPFHSAAQNTLKLYRIIEPDTWGKLMGRVNGVNFTGLYGGTTAMGWRTITLPKGHTWKSYMEFLLSTLPEETAKNYREKLNTSIEFWKNKGGVLAQSVIKKLRERGVGVKTTKKTNYHTNKITTKMEYLDDIDIEEFKEIPTYKRVCICIVKNDHTMKYMGFSPTKEQEKIRKEAEKKYEVF